MSGKNVTSGISLPSLDDLKGLSNPVGGISNEKNVIQVALDRLIPFKNHPYKVREDEHFKNLMSSIKEIGIHEPGLVRTASNGNFEIISGHCRKLACEKLGMKTMPVIVKDITDDEAIMVMVDSNIHRTKLLPSEKAKALKMRYDAMKRQGYTKNPHGATLNQMEAELGENSKKLQRYIKVADLNDGLLGMLDNKCFGLMQAYNLSFLDFGKQHIVEKALTQCGRHISVEQCNSIRKLADSGKLDLDAVVDLLSDSDTVKSRESRRNHNKPDIDASRMVFIPSMVIEDCFPKGTSQDDITKTIVTLLTEWQKRGDTHDLGS